MFTNIFYCKHFYTPNITKYRQYNTIYKICIYIDYMKILFALKSNANAICRNVYWIFYLGYSTSNFIFNFYKFHFILLRFCLCLSTCLGILREKKKKNLNEIWKSYYELGDFYGKYYNYLLYYVVVCYHLTERLSIPVYFFARIFNIYSILILKYNTIQY